MGEQAEKTRIPTPDYQYLFKIVIVGDTNVGKTNILTRLDCDEFDTESKPTIGVDFFTKTFEHGKEKSSLQFWDTAGQERYRAITTAYYRGANGGVIVYDITSKASYENAFSTWLKELRAAVGPTVPITVIGNKNDLVSLRQVNDEEAKRKADELGLTFFETSAKTSFNVRETFVELANQVYKKQKDIEKVSGKTKVRREDLISESIEKANEKKKKNSSCC